MPDPIDGSRGVYGISVAAELSGLGIQTLRLYEARGLLDPQRSEGGTRRYSNDDIARLAEISELVDQGLNLVGIGMVLGLQAENRGLRDRLANATRESDRADG